MRQILCVIDFSESAAKVWELAAKIAIACRAHLVVLFPYRLIDHSHRGDMTSLKLKLEKEAKEKFLSMKDQFPETKTVSYEFHAEIGFTSDRISAHIKANTIDMVIVGQQDTNPVNEIKNFNLHQLLTNSKLPFVIVPPEIKAEARVY